MGRLDARLRDAAFRIIDGLTTEKVAISRVVSVHDGTTGATTETTTRASVKGSPPLAFALDKVDGRNIHRGDMRMYVAAQGLSFDMAETKDASGNAVGFYVTHAATVYRVIPPVEPKWSGDRVAAYKLHLRI